MTCGGPPEEVAIGLNEWIYVLVEKSGNDEQIIAQHDTARDIRFIPVYQDRDSAQQGALLLSIQGIYEIQAVIFEDLLNYAARHKSLIFVLDGQGNVQLKIAPDGQVL